MWHEARKQERKIRGMLVDYRKRAERRQDFYERIKADPTQFIQMHGRKCKIHLDPAVAAAGESPAIMMPWQGQADTLIDRFDARAHLDFITPIGKSKEPEDPSPEERQCNYERYRILAQNDFLGMTEEKYLHQLHLEEQFGANVQYEVEKPKKRGTGVAIGYSYDDNSNDGQQSTPTVLQPSVPTTYPSEESDDSDVDVDVAINISKIDTAQAHELNTCGRQYGMKSNDFYSFLTRDADEADALKMAREEEQEKIMLSGRKSRRERRAQRERRFAGRPISPPSYAAKEEVNDQSENVDMESRSPSPENSGKITYITSFGGEDELQPHSKISINFNANKSGQANDSDGKPSEGVSYADKVKQNLDKLKQMNNIRRSPSKSPRKPLAYQRRRSPSRSRSRSRYRSRRDSRGRHDTKRYRSSRSRNRRSKRSRSVTPKRRRSYSRNRRRYRSPRSHSKGRRRQSISSSSSYSSSTSSRSSRHRTHKRETSVSSRSKSVSSSTSSSSSLRCPSSKNDKPVKVIEITREKITEPIESIVSSNVDVPIETVAIQPSQNIVPALVIPEQPPQIPVKKYYGRRRDDQSSSDELNDVETEASNKEIAVPLNSDRSPDANKFGKHLSANDTKAQTSSTALSKSSLNPRDRLKRKMQLLLNKQYKADKLAEIERNERQMQQQQEREDEMRELALRLRRRQRELRHKYGTPANSHSEEDKPSDENDDTDVSLIKSQLDQLKKTINSPDNSSRPHKRSRSVSRSRSRSDRRYRRRSRSKDRSHRSRTRSRSNGNYRRQSSRGGVRESYAEYRSSQSRRSRSKQKSRSRHRSDSRRRSRSRQRDAGHSGTSKQNRKLVDY